MGSFAETYNDPKSGGRELNLARKAQRGNHTRHSGPTTRHNVLQCNGKATETKTYA